MTQNRRGVEVSVKDFGIGIDQAEIDDIFDPFSRGSNASDIAGTGLSIVRKALESISGSIAVKSAKTSGTIFTINIPEKI